MLFDRRTADGIAAGTVTVTFRRWKRRQAVAGRRYRTPVGFIEVDRVDVVDPAHVTDEDARRSGSTSAAELLAGLRAREDDDLFRVEFRHVGGPDPRDELAATGELDEDEVADLDRRLERMDARSAHGPWTRAVLALIRDRPGVRAGDLAAGLGRDRDAFKADVRKLKALGLTTSLEVGYRLSPRGEAYLARSSRRR